MAEPSPGPSSEAKENASYIPKTAPEKLSILRRVATKIKEEIEGTVGARRPRDIDLTGLQPGFIEELSNRNVEYIDIQVREVERSFVYHQLMDLYINERVMPTTFYLFLRLFGKIPAYMDLGEFRKYLAKNGFMWKQILKGTCVVIENPEVTFERYSYLKNILHYRQQGKSIYFVDEVAFDNTGKILPKKQSISRQSEPQLRLIYAVSNQGVQVKQFVKENCPEAFLKWISDTLLKSLSQPSVIVLNNYKHHCLEVLPLPNEDSLKKEMCDWLEYFNVPHDPEMPKAVLFELAQKYTDLSMKIYVVDTILRQHGHDVLRLPDCIMKLSPATYYFDMLQENFLKEYTDVNPDVITTSINKIIDAVNEDHASQYSEVIVAEELAIFQKDSTVDSLLDNLENDTKSASVQYNGLDSELPSNESDSE